jgi:rhodanese-related sulfurtransferase
MVVRALVEQSDAVDIRGGFTAWRAAGLPLSGHVE